MADDFPQTGTQQKPWYKTTGGIVFLIILAFIISIILIFVAFFVYFSLQIRFGNAEELEQKFNSRFTSNQSVVGEAMTSVIEEDTKTFIRSHNATFGNPNAGVTIIVFSDFECQFSQQSFPIFQQVMQTYEPAIKVVFKNISLGSTDAPGFQASVAASCANQQNKFLEYYNILFTQKNFDQVSLIKYAEDLGLNKNLFTACLKAEKNIFDIQQDIKDAIALNLRGTPTFIVNNKKIEGVADLNQWTSIILSELEQTK